jgi:hypothetical protein
MKYERAVPGQTPEPLFFFAILIIDYIVSYDGIVLLNQFQEYKRSVIKVYFRMMPFCFDDSEAIG